VKMRLPSSRPGIVLRAAFALCLLSLPLTAWQQTADSDDDDDDSGPPAATVILHPKLRGDVEIYIYATGLRKPVDLEAMVRSAMNCDWRGRSAGSFYLDGTCRHLLHTNRGAVEDKLALAPLAIALSKAGFPPVKFQLSANGEPGQSAGLNWVKAGKDNGARKGTGTSTWHFQASGDVVLPPPFLVRLGSQWSPSRLGAPLLSVLFGPALLALWIRRQMTRKSAAPGSGVVWLNWILLGAWLYWISAVRIEDLGALAAGLNLDSSLATLLIGSLFFSLPPLLATATCLLALAPQAQPGVESSAQIPRLLRRTLAAEATFVVPLGLFLVGTTLMENEWRTGMLSMVAAYAAYRLLAWCTWRWDSQRMFGLDGGELRERAVAIAIAQAAKVDVKAVYVLENRFPMEANAFAMPGGRISFTRGLLENMPRREVDAVIAHEVGHLRGKHIGMRTGLFVAYLVVIGPAIGSFMTKAGLPAWAMALPIAPMLYVLLAGQLSQSNELNADARAVQLTNDPEGTIAALARLARLTRSPVDWGGIQGSILSHPSIERRVLSVARRFGVPEPRAIEILKDPDVLAGESTESALSRYPLPQHIERADPEFTSSAKLSHAYWAPWVFGSMLLSWMVLLAYFSAQAFYRSSFGPLWSVLIFFVSLPLVGWLTLKLDDWWDCLFIRRMRRKIEAHSPVPGMCVALIPGDRILTLEGQYAWDLGRLSLDAERLTYRGERTQFSVPRSEVTGIEIRKSRAGWCRTYAVVLRSAQAAFSLRLADRGRTRRLARRLEEQLNSWWRSGVVPLPAVETEPLPAPDLPNVQPATPTRLRVVWVLGIRTALLFFGAIFLFSVSSMMERSPMFAFVPFTAPLVYLAVVCPELRRPE
jgi:Zn-dependent protease with chaperone function/energy-coupling factor transporter transmembrane protein EcfT